jgi:hypothetical protein
LIKFTSADALQVIEIWQELTGRTVIRPNGLLADKITLRSQTELTRHEAIWLIEAALKMANVATVHEGDKFSFAVPLERTNTLPRFDRQAAMARTIVPVGPTNGFRLANVDLAKLAEAYAAATARQAAPVVGAAAPVRFDVRAQTPLDQAELIYLLEAVGAVSDCRFEIEGAGQFRLVAPPPPPPAPRPVRPAPTPIPPPPPPEL